MNKVLDNDICDELNKLLVNDKIIQLRKSIIQEKRRCSFLYDEVEELTGDIADFKRTIEDNEFVDIDALIVSMTNGRRIDDFTIWIDDYGERGLYGTYVFKS